MQGSAARIELTYDLTTAIAKLVDDANEAEYREPSHYDLEEVFRRAGVADLDPKQNPSWRGGKRKRVAAVLNDAVDSGRQDQGRSVVEILQWLLEYVRSEEALQGQPDFVAAEAAVLAAAIVEYFATDNTGSGFVDDQTYDQDIGGGGRPSGCVEPDYGIPWAAEPTMPATLE
jgi:hypothetical protein